MTPQDREQFRALARRQAQLEEELAQLRAEFEELQQRADSPAPSWIAGLPPLPPALAKQVQAEPPPMPPILPPEIVPVLETSRATTETAPEPSPQPSIALPPPPPEIAEEKEGLEFQFGRWLARIGVVFALITLISFSTFAYRDFHQYLGPWSKLAVLALASLGLFGAGLGVERKNPRLTVYGRTLAGGGLACLYYTLYGATYVSQLRVIGSPLLGGILLLVWSAFVLYLAERKKSELLSIFAIALAYFSSVITPVGGFIMVANLLLSLTAVIFLIRNAWTGLSYLCLVCTYAGLLRQFVTYDHEHWPELIHVISFWPAADYLAGAWVIYTAGVFFAHTPAFAAGKRMAFLCLNNGALVGLLTLTAQLSGFGHVGTILCLIGGLFLATAYLIPFVRTDAREMAKAYLIQGLALVTGGLVMVYSGVTRGLLLTTESVFLAAAGAFSRNRIFRISAYVTSPLGTAFLIGEIIQSNHLTWVLPLGGAAAMLANAWLARRDLWSEPREVAGARFVFSSAFYILLALGILITGNLVLHANDAWLAIDFALAALVLTFAVYLVPLFELPLMSQVLLVLAQMLAFLPLGSADYGAPWNLSASAQSELFFSPARVWQSQYLVALVTMILVVWWPRQKTVRTGFWLSPLILLYALAMAVFCFNTVHPHVDAQGWMLAASLLSLLFLAYGAWTRTWQFMLAGQIFLALAVWTFFNPATGAFPWSWWAAAVPPAVVFATGSIARRWISRFVPTSESIREGLDAAAYLYQTLALVLAVRWIFGIVPVAEITLALFLLATGLLLWNVWRPSAFGARTGLIVDLVGAANYLFAFHGFTSTDALAFALFLAQPALLRRWGRELVTTGESWVLIIISAGSAWLFVSHSIQMAEPHNLTLGWAIFALAMIVIGFAANERRQRWCGLAILIAAILRVGFYDFWGFSDLYKVLTFLALTLICLGLSFFYYKFSDRLKEWL